MINCYYSSNIYVHTFGGYTPSGSTILMSTVLVKTLAFSRIIEHLTTLCFWTPTFSVLVNKPYILFRSLCDFKRSLSIPAVMSCTISLPDLESCFATSFQLSFSSGVGIFGYLTQSADRLPLKIFHCFIQAILVQAAENHYKQSIPPLNTILETEV